MSGRFVRASKFRHVYGQPAKREKYYDNIRLTKNAWDSNLIKVNPKYLSVNWDASGGGAFAVIPLEEYGRLPDVIPLFRGHTAPVLDTDWNPFDDDVIASASDDGTIAIWRVPEGFTTRRPEDEEAEVEDVSPVKRLKGHNKKVGHVVFHPIAEDILASSSADYTVKLWNIKSEECLTTLEHKDLITSMAFNEAGSLLATVCRDKTIRVWDVRKGEVVSQGKGHNGAKSQRLAWLGSHDRLVSTGFNGSDRQMAIWDAHSIEKGPVGGFQFNGQSSGICMPFFDEGTNCIYFAGKGDGNVQYYEYDNDSLYPLSEYMSTDPQRGVAVMPRRALDVHNHEVVRMYKTVNDNSIEPLSFIVPRRAETFQEDVYPEARAGEPALSGEEWWSGKDARPKVFSLAAVFDGGKPEVHTATDKKPEPKKEEPPKKEQPKKEPVKAEPAKAAPEEPKNIDEIMKGSGVDKFLDRAKNAAPDDRPLTPAQKEDSAWKSDDDEPEVKVASAKPVEAEPVKAEPIKAEPVKAEPVKAEPVKAEPVKAEPVKAEPVKPEPVKTEPVKTKPEGINGVWKPLSTSELENLEQLFARHFKEPMDKFATMMETQAAEFDRRMNAMEEKIHALLEKQKE